MQESQQPASFELDETSRQLVDGLMTELKVSAAAESDRFAMISAASNRIERLLAENFPFGQEVVYQLVQDQDSTFRDIGEAGLYNLSLEMQRRFGDIDNRACGAWVDLLGDTGEVGSEAAEDLGQLIANGALPGSTLKYLVVESLMAAQIAVRNLRNRLD